MNEVWNSSWMKKPRCPHCNEEITTPWEYNLRDEDSVGIWCGWCEKTMTLACKITAEYRTERDGSEAVENHTL